MYVCVSVWCWPGHAWAKWAFSHILPACIGKPLVPSKVSFCRWLGSHRQQRHRHEVWFVRWSEGHPRRTRPFQPSSLTWQEAPLSICYLLPSCLCGTHHCSQFVSTFTSFASSTAKTKGENSPGAELWRIPPCWSYWTIAILQPVIWVTLKDWRSAIILVWEDSKRSCKIGPGHSFWWLNHHQAPILLHQPMNMYRKAWTYSTHPYLSCSIILPSINKLWLPMMKVFCGSFFSRVEKSDEQTWSAKVCGAGGTERAFSGIHNTVNSSNISHLVSSFGSFFGLCYARLLGVLLLCCWERHSMPLLFPARWHL